jgi:hypothetical protein
VPISYERTLASVADVWLTEELLGDATVDLGWEKDLLARRLFRT